MTMRGGRQAPPPPPQAPLPEDFQDMNPRGSQKPRSVPTRQAPEEQFLEEQKKEMQAELDAKLKLLEGERKEGLYRLDWELAEAIETLHENHAAKANKMIAQHRETISLMEKKAQAGEELTPEMVQRLRKPVQAPAPPPRQQHFEQPPRQHSVEEVSEEESVEESEEESVEGSVYESEEAPEEGDGLLGRFMNMMRGDNRPPVPVQRLPPNGQRNDRQVCPPGFSSPQQRSAPSPADFYHDPQRQFMNAGANGYPEVPNGSAPVSPLAMISGSLGFSSGTEAPDFPSYEVPFANGHQGSPSGAAEPSLPALLNNALGLSFELSPNANEFRNFPQAAQNAPNWPPPNIFYGGGHQ